MSIEVIARVLKKKWGSPSRKLVALKLADTANEDGTSIYPALQTVADECELSKRQVQRTMSEFRADGLLVLVKEGGSGPRDTTAYRFDMTMIGKLPDVKNKNDTMSPITSRKSDIQSQKGCHHVTQPVIDPSTLSNERAGSSFNDPSDKSRFQKKSDEVWRELPALLCIQNPNDQQNRSLIGQWQKRTPSIGAKNQLLEFAKAARHGGTPEPIDYISKAMNRAFPKRESPQIYPRAKWESICKLTIGHMNESLRVFGKVDLAKVWDPKLGAGPGNPKCKMPTSLQGQVLAALQKMEEA